MVNGREFFYRHLRTQRIPVARNRMFALMKELDPVGVEEQCKDAYNRHGTFQVPGPNFLWSIDGHLKLQAYGIEIYAGIDVYARYVPWNYVGVSG